MEYVALLFFALLSVLLVMQVWRWEVRDALQSVDKNRADGHTGTGSPVTPAYRRETKPVCPAVKQCLQSHDHCAFRRMVLFYSFFFLRLICLFGHTAQLVVSYFPDQGSNLCPLQWKLSILTTGPPGRFQSFLIKRSIWTWWHLWCPRNQREYSWF